MSQRALSVTVQCVVQYVTNDDTSDTLLFSIQGALNCTNQVLCIALAYSVSVVATGKGIQ
jgi:hypothetical protein